MSEKLESPKMSDQEKIEYQKLSVIKRDFVDALKSVGFTWAFSSRYEYGDIAINISNVPTWGHLLKYIMAACQTLDVDQLNKNINRIKDNHFRWIKNYHVAQGRVAMLKNENNKLRKMVSKQFRKS